MIRKGESWQEAHNRREMKKTYESAEWLLRKRLESAAYLVYKLRQEATILSVNVEFSKQYLDEKILLLIEDMVKEHQRSVRTKQGACTEVLSK